ncbi:RNA polymerase sigma factor [Actinacidiphila cocklensis]|uniref:Sigma-70 family RNA polymerase sigma factor n=1 Tax=Actinacidiphila cocklensis TaxID=887465 RepID=A0A9W4GSA7_9ACTN|nr:sigma-70 family RNA polymerase sigma factor [Actinacidiphila cocklensis]CAG6395257.1 Sigma-70 family RNA polymerase sigma factor [Actinacidiphila cocklensis]
MNNDAPNQAAAAPDSQTVGALPHLPLEYEAFYLGHQAAFHDYAEVNLGHHENAVETVHRGFLEILGSWETLLSAGNLEQQAWAIMRRLVTTQLEADGRPPALVINGPIHRALSTTQILDAARDQLQLMDSSRGLYAAIADLPARQSDVIVLRYVIGYDSARIAWLLGLKNERTVDYQLRRARERLRVQLGLPAETAPRRGARP